MDRDCQALANTTQRYKHVHGFTSIELLVVVAIVALLAVLGGPSFASLIESWRVRQTSEQMKSTLYFARSEAVKRGGGVVIQKIPNNANGCSSANGVRDWDCGWIVCEDRDRNGGCDANDPVLQHLQAKGDVRVSRAGGGATIKLNRWGLVDGTFVSFRMFPLGRTTVHPGAQGLCMSSGGRIRSAAAAC